MIKFNILKVTAIIFLILTSFKFILAQELSPEVILHKISKRLIGKKPSIDDYDKLNKQIKKSKCNSVDCLNSFFKEYIQDKMNQDEFYALFYEKITARWGYKNPISLQLSDLFFLNTNIYSAMTRRDFALVYYILKNNLSFDEFYTNQFIIEPFGGTDLEMENNEIVSSSIDLSDFKSLDMISKNSFKFEIKKLNNNYVGTLFDLSGHHNISGLFSSSVYWTRYWNTSLNQERKRAAHFFKIMLCDSMLPALDRDAEKKKEIKMSAGQFTETSIQKELENIHKNKHASQKDCAACHAKLDPLGFALRGIELGVSNIPFEGILKVNSSLSGQLEAISVKGLQDLTKKTTKLPQYFDCQMNWLIEDFLGKDLKISSMKFIDIEKNVEMKKRKIKDVVEYLLMLPEFRNAKSTFQEPQSFIQAKEVLSNCTDCHSDFFSLRPSLLKNKLQRISECMSLKDNGHNSKMPPSDHYWQPSTDELLKVKQWIQEGAPMTDQLKLLESNEVQKIFYNDEGGLKCRD